MNEKIITVEKTFKEFTSSNSEVKEKKRAEEILKKLNVVKKRMKINTETKIAIQEFLNEKTLSNETTLKLINSKLNEFNNDDSDAEVFENNKKEEQKPEKEEIEKKEEQQEKEPEDEIGKEKPEKEKNSGNSKAEELAREGWSDVYILSKMLSLGYIPKLHDTKFSSGFKGQKIKWVLNKGIYFGLGGSLTNGTFNSKMNETRESIRKWLTGLFIGEETKLKFLLKNIEQADNTGYKTQLTKRIECLKKLKDAISTNKSETEIKTLSDEYAKITEKTLTIEKLYETQEIGKKYEDFKKKKGEKAKKIYEEDIENKKKEILDKFDERIEEENNKIKASNDGEEEKKNKLNDNIEDLENKKNQLNNDFEDLKKEKDILDNDIKDLEKKKNLARKPEKKLVFEGEITTKKSELGKINGEITTKKSELGKINGEITTKKREVIDFKYSNEADIKKINKDKKLLTDLKTAVETGNYKEAKRLLNSDPSFKLETGKNYEAFMKKDHNSKAESEKKKGENSVEEKNVKTEAIDDEIKKVEKNVLEIEKEMGKIKKEAEIKIKKLDDVASMNPDKLPELRADVEKIVEDYNKQIIKLESEGVNNLKQLNIKDIENLSLKSKWTRKIIDANKWIDKKSSGIAGKIFGVGAMALLAGGAYSMYKEDGGLNATFYKDFADMGLGMIPIIGGAYDLRMAQVRGRDWNDRPMESSEKWLRTGFGVIGLVPFLGTIVKWSATSGKIAKATSKAVKVSQFGETIIEGGHLVGKVAGLTYLGYTGLATVSYVLPNSIENNFFK